MTTTSTFHNLTNSTAPNDTQHTYRQAQQLFDDGPKKWTSSIQLLLKLAMWKTAG